MTLIRMGAIRMSAIFLAAVATCLPSAAHAWGAQGHKIVAAVAAGRLAPEVRQEVDRLLQAADLPDMIEAAPWADHYRFGHPETEPWHFVDIPANATAFDEMRDCPDHDCSIAKIIEFQQVAGDGTRTDSDRGVALAFLIHLIGDIHQPLHAADRGDHSGLALRISFFGEQNYHGYPMNLHGAWDTYIIDHFYGRQDPVLVARLLDDHRMPLREDAAPFATQVVAWAQETHGYALSRAYGALPPGTHPDIGERYVAMAKPVIDHQLLYAGLRLAETINAALASPAN